MTIDDIDNDVIYNIPGNTYFEFVCKKCKCSFNIRAVMIRSMKKGTTDKQYCCSRKCASALRNKSEQKTCIQCCNIYNTKYPHQKFCSQSCSATYRNTHKTHGIRRSKLEIWVEQRLTEIYPNLEFHFNRKDTINSELDIYIPSIQLAFELNGIFHYEPIFSESQLLKCQTNDNRKMQACYERNIELCVIDTSSQKYFKPASSQKYLDIIVNIINSKITV